MRKLFFFTIHFPYGKQETFIETEIKYLAQNFDEIHIYTFYKINTGSESRSLASNVFIHEGFIENNYFVRLLKSLFLIKLNVIGLFIKDFLSKKVYKTRHNLASWFFNFVNVTLIYNSKSYKHIKTIDDGIFYFYVGVSFANMLHFLPRRKNVKYVVRLHGGDTYLPRNNGYIPLRDSFYNLPDYFIPISDDLKHYLKNIYNVPDFKIEVQRLGTIFQSLNPEPDNSAIHIVTCSNVIPLKRLSLLVAALHKILDQPVVWNHFGDGPDYPKLKKDISRLPGNIRTILHGRVRNIEVLNFYKENGVDIFINLSSHEGIPVSIMEAMSFGIPCLATDVGATRELVNNSNGKIVHANFELNEIVETILCSKSADWKKKRSIAHKFWDDHYNADKNYNNLNEFFNRI